MLIINLTNILIQIQNKNNKNNKNNKQKEYESQFKLFNFNSFYFSVFFYYLISNIRKKLD